jgi:hypothetical protein
MSEDEILLKSSIIEFNRVIIYYFTKILIMEDKSNYFSTNTQDRLGTPKFHRKRKHYELEHSDLENKMLNLTITKKLKTGSNTHELITYSIENRPLVYDADDEKRAVELYYRDKNKKLFHHMFGSSINN